MRFNPRPWFILSFFVAVACAYHVKATAEFMETARQTTARTVSSQAHVVQMRGGRSYTVYETLVAVTAEDGRVYGCELSASSYAPTHRVAYLPGEPWACRVPPTWPSEIFSAITWMLMPWLIGIGSWIQRRFREGLQAAVAR